MACSGESPIDADGPNGDDPSTVAGGGEPEDGTGMSDDSSESESSTTTVSSPGETSSTTTRASPYEPPAWLGTVVLPLRPDGHGEVQPTPTELEVRQFRTIDRLPPPVGETFEASVGPVPDDVLARSTWSQECPVGIDELQYVTVTFVGFDGDPHTGELLVHERAVDDIVEVFRELHDANYPIEDMTILSQADLEAPPTGDRNNTSAFECRRAVGSASFSEHAYGLAIDLNPFQNPYRKGDLVLPELASAYLDRSRDLPGMIQPGGPVVAAFASIGWEWGGNWTSLEDYHHFSESGR